MTQKTRTDEIDARQEDHEEERHTTERNEKQDLDQGMDTGTHDTVKHGVDWKPSYQGRRNKKNKTNSTSNS